MDPWDDAHRELRGEGDYGWLCAICYWYFVSGETGDDGRDGTREEFFHLEDWFFSPEVPWRDQTCMCCGVQEPGMQYAPAGVVRRKG